ncbi:MAG: hypothetical protein HYY84_13355 [Deltaproteobacteria bacterium]|nr:hypothetical protein [Deltaproteobacteria bacterium]
MVSLFFALLLSSCADKPTAENVRRWASRKERAKLVAALKHAEAPADVRCDAALALVVGGDTAQVIGAAADARVSKDLLICLPLVLKGAEVDKHTHAVAVLSGIVEKVDPAAREALAGTVGKWMMDDFLRRFQKDLVLKLGVGAIEPMVAAQKSGAFKALTRRERDAEKGRAMRNLALVVGPLAKAATRAKVAAGIVADFPKNAPLPQPAIDGLAELKAEGAAELAKLLVDAKADLAMRREIPSALAFKGDSTAIPKIMPVLRDSNEDIYVRGNILLYMNEVCSKATCGALADSIYPFLKDEYPSMASANLLLKIVGVPALERVLKNIAPAQALSGGEVNKLVDERIVPLGEKALPALTKALRGRNWIGKVFAIRALAKMGGTGEVGVLMKLRGDKFRAEHWKDETTLGAEATRAVKAIQERRAR